MNITILLTCVGSQVSPSVIQAIRCHPKLDVKIVGIDNRNKAEAVGAHFVDSYYQAPLGTDPEYLGIIEEIIAREDVKVILPGSDEEALALSKGKARLRDMGCVVACADFSTIELAVDKYRTMKILRERGVTVADCFEFHSIRELEECAEKLGFPEKSFVIKPRVSRGGRGFRVVRSDVDPFTSFMQADTTSIDFRELVKVLESAPDRMGDFFIMDFLPGKKYSTDILVREGKMNAIVIRNKLFPVGSPTQLADIVYEQDLIGYATSILDILDFEYFVQFEIGRDEIGRPKLIEINPRLDATLPICLGTGINFYHEMISHAAGETYSDQVRIIDSADESVRFIRYWQHRFIRCSSTH